MLTDFIEQTFKHVSMLHPESYTVATRDNHKHIVIVLEYPLANEDFRISRAISGTPPKACKLFIIWEYRTNDMGLSLVHGL